jgi:hypothetical protein
MAKKRKRRPFRRPNPQQRTEDAARKQTRLQSAAQSLLSTRSAEQIKQEVAAREWDLAEADRLAQLEPNPANLSRYRFALEQHEVAVAALRIAAGWSREAGEAAAEERPVESPAV